MCSKSEIDCYLFTKEIKKINVTILEDVSSCVALLQDLNVYATWYPEECQFQYVSSANIIIVHDSFST